MALAKLGFSHEIVMQHAEVDDSRYERRPGVEHYPELTAGMEAPEDILRPKRIGHAPDLERSGGEGIIEGRASDSAVEWPTTARRRMTSTPDR
jgi:hypothetical protein